VPSGWEVYYVVFLSAVLALGIPLALRLISSVFTSKAPARPSKPEDAAFWKEKTRLAEPRDQIGAKINTRFFLGTNAGLLLLTLALVLIPCVGAFHVVQEGRSMRGLVSILSLTGLSALALLYAVRKGDLDWLRTTRGGGRK
jgi:hypothetical protein